MLLERVKPWFLQAKKVIRNRWFRIAIQGVILALCAVYLVSNLQSIRSANVLSKVNIPLILASLGITIGVVFLGALGYYWTLRAFKLKIRWSEAFNIHLQSNLAKYIPGYAWQLVGKAYLTGEVGFSIGIIGLAMATELFQLVVTGLLVVILYLPVDFLARFGINLNPGSPILYPHLIAIVIIIILAIVAYWILRQSKRFIQVRELDPLRLVGASTSMFAGWILFGFSYWLLGKALFTVTIQQLNVYIFTLAASILIGLAIVIVPASIGVRESIMVWVLGPLIGAPQAVILAALARVVVTLSEILSAYGFKILKPGLINPKGLDQNKDPE